MKIEERCNSLENTPRSIARIDAKRMDAFCEDLCLSLILYIHYSISNVARKHTNLVKKGRGGEG